MRSKAVKDGYIFFALKGSRFDGTQFINEAIDRSAYAIVLKLGWNDVSFKRGATFIYVTDAKLALSEACRSFYGDVSKEMYLIGITGTNGKTTITYLLESIFADKKEDIGVIGTINYRFGRRVYTGSQYNARRIGYIRSLKRHEKT